MLMAATLAAPAAGAADVAPDALLKAVTLEVMAVIRAGTPATLGDLVETKILPHFDFDHMTQMATGPGWRLATPGQQQALTREFMTLLVRTYSAALSSVRDQVIEFRPLRSPPEGTDVTVRTLVKQSGAAALTIDYDMQHMPNGWKVYDIKIEGVSLIATYRETFAARIRESGIDGLIKLLAEKNRRAA